MAVLLEGSLEVVHDGPEGATVLLRTLEAGAVLGEIACLDGQARSATVRAITPCRVARIAGDVFRTFLEGRPDIVQDLFEQQLQRVRTLTREVARTYERAITDTLTGLYNIGFFRERLELELARARHTGDPLSLVLLDIDHFKHYNDSHGHEEGNEALKRVAAILKSHGRRGDIVARYGGEEFVALLYGAVREEAFRYAEELRRAVEATHFAGGSTQPLGGRVTLSGGVSTFPVDTAEADPTAALLTAADACQYRAKEGGRNRIVVGC